MKLMQPYLHQGYHLYFDNFYTSFALVNDLFALGVPSCGTVGINRKGMPESLKNVKTWAKNEERGDMRWERIKPTLVLQWKDNKPVSLLTSIDIASEKVLVKRKQKTAGIWREVFVRQPQAINNYNQYMNAVDRSDQLLTANNVRRKCYRWWKTLFFHLIDMSIVNAFILFKEYQAKFPDNEDPKRPASYTMAEFREEIVRVFSGFPEYGSPPIFVRTPPAQRVGEFDTVHIPCFSNDQRKYCVVCYKQGRGQLRVNTYCCADQCGQFLHITRERNCFREWHS